MVNRKFVGQVVMSFIMGLMATAGAQAQQIVQDALAILPADTVRMEYSNPAKLRSLSRYSQLRDRFLGSELKTLVSSLAQLGVQEQDVEELVLSWQGGGGGMVPMDGIATGKFDAHALAEHAKDRGISGTAVGGMTAYCFGADAGSLCVMAVKGSEGAFGTMDALKRMADVQAAQAPALVTNAQFVKLVEQGRADAPIWGVAVGPSVGDWFQGWLPQQNQVKLNWDQTFQGVEALTYSVNPSNRLSLNANFECSSDQASTNLQTLLVGMKAFEQMAWQSQYPNRPNPYTGLQVEASNRRVHVSLTADYDELLPASSANP